MARQSYAALQAKIEKEIVKLQKQAQALQNKKRLPVIRSIVKSMREYEITPEEIVSAFNKGGSSKTTKTTKPSTRARGPRGPVAPKYRDNQSGQTWTGRGKAPRWITEAEASGRNRAEFLIQASDAAAQ